VFINNAQTGYAQTELLYEVWSRWQGKERYIWNISTMMTKQPINSRQDEMFIKEFETVKENPKSITWEYIYIQNKTTRFTEHINISSTPPSGDVGIKRTPELIALYCVTERPSVWYFYLAN
jgi:hypothetical protein